MNDSSLTHMLETDELKIATDAHCTESLLFQGEMCLLKGDLHKGIAFFESANKISPLTHTHYFRQGLALFEYGSEDGKEKALFLACKKFKTALALDPEFFDAWYFWGNCLSVLGASYKQQSYFLEALEKYQKALSFSKNQQKDILADFYWDYGSAWLYIAGYSEEAVDLQSALEAFHLATSFRDHLPSEFWKDYGLASFKLAKSVNDLRLYVKAINCFKHAIATGASSSDDSWGLLANTLKMLYANTHDEDHFSQANECYSAAVQLHPQDVDLWLEWAKFLCDSGKRNQDIKRLRSCIEKCHRAYACNPQNALVIAIWAEALACIGDLSDRLDLIYEAQNKISEALAITNQDPDVLYSHGMCLSSFGHYFSDLDYYYQAIEKFQAGLSIDRTCYRHWHAIASTYTTVGTLEGNTEALEQSLRFYQKAIDLYSSSYATVDYALALSKLGEMTHQQKWLEQSIHQFERALAIQKNAIYIHPDWLFHYASTLDMLGDFYEEDTYYTRAIEILSHVLMIDPDFPGIHHRLALAFTHLGELAGELEHFYRAVHHYRLAAKHEEENDQIILDWGITLIHIAEHLQAKDEADQYYRDAEHKITQAAKLGNSQAYYHLACLYAIVGQYEKAMRFIEKADAFESLPSLEEILQDDWLDGLRSTSYFREFLSDLEKRPNLQEER